MPGTPDAPRWSFVVDEDLPRSMAFTLRAAGYPAYDVRDAGLADLGDRAVYGFAQQHGQTLVSGDAGYANTLNYPLGAHAGIVVLRLPAELAAPHVAQALLNGLGAVAGQSLAGTLLVIEPGRLRLSRLPAEGTSGS
jgi:predicted nuclease of predicted toxin-antitoxin system